MLQLGFRTPPILIVIPATGRECANPDAKVVKSRVWPDINKVECRDMPLIAYQSFNANSSKDHGLAATSLQRFTRDTNSYVTGLGHKALVLPHDAGHLDSPIEGPANLVPVQPLQQQNSKKRKRDDGDTAGPPTKLMNTGTPTVHAFGAQISLLWQNFYRQFGQMPGILVCGELDSSHADFTGLVDGENITVKAIQSAKACQSFTAISQTKSLAGFVSSGEGYVVYSIANMNVVFVHVPNSIAKKKEDTKKFYNGIAQTMLGNGKIIHLVIGDTNQGSAEFTKDALNAAFQTQAYTNALDSKTISKVDNYNVTERGTNAKGTQFYDVAVYRSDIVELKKAVAYLSQSSNAITVTDHCGLGVVVELKGTK